LRHVIAKLMAESWQGGSGVQGQILASFPAILQSMIANSRLDGLTGSAPDVHGRCSGLSLKPSQ